MLRSLLLLIFMLLTAIQCKEQNGEETKSSLSDESQVADTSQEARSSDEIKLLQSIAEAHRKEAFLDKKAVVFDIDLNFGGEDRLDATISMLTDGSAIRIDKTDGSSLVFDGSQIYLSPENADAAGARFAIFTWPYFFAFPYKLEDPGTNFEYLGKLNLNGTPRKAFKLSFDPGTGDAPDDWYVSYLNPDNTIHAAGYIVTYGDTPQEQAEESPHAIVYSDYKEVDGVPFATNWTFYNWSRENGLQGDPLGEATLTNIRFTAIQPDFFSKPESAQIIE